MMDLDRNYHVRDRYYGRWSRRAILDNRDGEYEESSASEEVALVDAPIGRESARDEMPGVQDAEL